MNFYNSYVYMEFVYLHILFLYNVHHLLDMALPNNRIPRVFIDTGIEYQMIRKFVLDLAKNDDRFVILKPTQNIKQMLEKYGYPFKSKQHSHNLSL